jgi:lipid-A-disaccharide synthase-like uncharacterized protein
MSRRKNYLRGISYSLPGTLFLVFLLPLIARAQSPFVRCTGLNCKLSDLLDIPVRIYEWATGFAASVCIALVMFGGIRLLVYYFSDAPEGERRDAWNTIKWAVTGFLIVMLSYLIVKTLVVGILGANTGLFTVPVFKN